MTDKPDKITISMDRWEEIQERLRWLDALENAGVDNWEGIDYAQELFGDGEDDED